MAERLIIIDGYNLILRSPSLAPGPTRTLRESRDKLVNLLAWAVGSGEARFLVVFDGAEDGRPDERQSRVEVRFSRPPEKADDLIRRLVEHELDRHERLTVVTADLEVARHARAMGAEVALSDLFLSSVIGPVSQSQGEVDPDTKPPTLTKKDLEEWVEIFRTHGTRPLENAPEDEAPE